MEIVPPRQPTTPDSIPDTGRRRMQIVPPREPTSGAENKDKGSQRLSGILTAAPVREAISNVFRNATGRVPSQETIGNISSQTASRLWNRKVLGNIAADMLISGSAGAIARTLALSLGPQGWMVAAAAGGASAGAREIYTQIRERRNENPDITLTNTLNSLNGRRIGVAVLRGATVGVAAGEIVAVISHIDIEGVQNAMNQAGQAIGERFGAAKSTVSNLVRGTASSVGEGVSNAGKAVSGVASGAMEKAGEKAAEAGNTVSGAASGAAQGIGESARGVSNAASGTAQAIGETVESVGNTVSGTAGQIGQTAGEKFGEASGTVSGAVKGVGEGLSSIKPPEIKLPEVNVPEAVSGAAQRAGEGLQGAGNTVSGAAGQAGQIAGELGKNASEFTQGVRDDIAQRVPDLSGVRLPEIQVPDPIQEARQAIGQTAESVSNTVSGAAGQIGQVSRGLIDQAPEPVKVAGKFYVKAKGDISEKIGEVLRGIFGDGTTATSTPAQLPDMPETSYAETPATQPATTAIASAPAPTPSTVPVAPTTPGSIPLQTNVLPESGNLSYPDTAIDAARPAAPTAASAPAPTPSTVPVAPTTPDSIPPTTALNGAEVSGSVIDNSITYEGKPWVLLDNGTRNIGTLLQTVGETGTIDKQALAASLQEATKLWVHGELKPSAHPDLWRLFHLSNGTANVFGSLLDETTLGSLEKLGIVGK